MTEYKEVGEISEAMINYCQTAGITLKIYKDGKLYILPVGFFQELASALFLPNKSNEEIVEEFEKKFYSLYDYDGTTYKPCHQELLDWLRTNLKLLKPLEAGELLKELVSSTAHSYDDCVDIADISARQVLA